MSNLIEHARRELELCGQFKEDPAFAVSVLAAVAAFASYPGHSGGSAEAGAEMISDLLHFRNLSPLTNDPDEWQDRSEESGVKMWQNKRSSNAFSEDGGETFYRVDEPLDEHSRRWTYATKKVKPETDEVPVDPKAAN